MYVNPQDDKVKQLHPDIGRNIPQEKLKLGKKMKSGSKVKKLKKGNKKTEKSVTAYQRIDSARQKLKRSKQSKAAKTAGHKIAKSKRKENITSLLSSLRLIEDRKKGEKDLSKYKRGRGFMTTPAGEQVPVPMFLIEEVAKQDARKAQVRAQQKLRKLRQKYHEENFTFSFPTKDDKPKEKLKGQPIAKGGQIKKYNYRRGGLTTLRKPKRGK